MTKIQITNGTVKYERNIKTADYEGKKATVELSFSMPEGEDHHTHLEHVGKTAINHCHAMLGSGSHPTASTSAVVGAANSAGKGIDAAKIPARGGRKPSDTQSTAKETEEAQEAAAVQEAQTKAGEKAQTKVEAKEKETETQVKGEEILSDTDLGDLLGEGGSEPAREITDKELNDATQSCQVRVKNAPAIRKILSDFGIKQPGGRLIDLPQAKRQEYLEKLKDIKPLA